MNCETCKFYVDGYCTIYDTSIYNIIECNNYYEDDFDDQDWLQ